MISIGLGRHEQQRRQGYVLRAVLRSWIPRRHRARLQALLRRIRGVPLRGRSVVCPCCQHSFSRFLAHGRPPRLNAMCPHCGALERHRFLWLYLQREKEILTKPPWLLHVAPEPAIRALLKGIPGLRYITVDRSAETVAIHCDVQALPLGDAAVSAIICYHVLEHVANDRQAMRELHRVLQPGGWAVFEVPIRVSERCTDEAPEITDPGERFRRFGQEDHVRWYGMDFFSRLSEAGFCVAVKRYDDLMPAELIARHALWKDGLVAVCSR